MEFCQNCNNYLYIKEDPEQKKIISYCKSCDYQKERTEYCILKKIYKKSESRPYINHKYTNDDPTYPCIDIKCPKCKKEGHYAYYQCTNLSIIVVCSHADCNHDWTYYE